MKAILGTMTFGSQVNISDSAEMVKLFREASHHELDTAFVYNKGDTEKLLGELQEQGVLDNTYLAGKVNPNNDDGLSPVAVDHQLQTSLKRVKREQFDLLYLHSPDLQTPIEDTLAAVQRHFEAGRFRHFGLSNYASWQVAEIAEICKARGYVQPTVYQGMYNALTRDVERELFPCLANYDIGFYVYNPLAGGMLSGKHTTFDAAPPEGRFSNNKSYLPRYWKQSYFDVIKQWVQVCEQHGISPPGAAIRWLRHHSDLTATDTENGGKQDHGVVLGASSINHLKQNLEAFNEGPLPDDIVNALDQGWEQIRPNCIKYFRP